MSIFDEGWKFPNNFMWYKSCETKSANDDDIKHIISDDLHRYSIALPGVSRDKIKVSVVDNAVKIHVNVEDKSFVEKTEYTILTNGCDMETVNVRHSDGLLCIELKKTVVEERSVEVK